MKRKGILEFMKNCLSDPEYNEKISSNETIVALIKTLFSDFYKHYGFWDVGKYGCHKLRFFLLYIDKNDFTFEKMSEKTSISVEAFKKWVKFYNKIALKVVVDESKNNQDYAFLLKKYTESEL